MYVLVNISFAIFFARIALQTLSSNSLTKMNSEISFHLQKNS